MGSLFATKQKTNSSGTQQGTTESNYWDQPGLQEFLGGYNSQFSGPNISQVQAPVNSWQTGAVTNQSGLPGGLGNAFDAANSVATNGLDPNRINAFMSPYIQSVVNPTLETQRIQNEQATSNIRGNSATRGALGNNTGQTAAYYAGVQPGQQAQIAGLYNQGFNQAGQLATQDVMSRLQGAGQVGNLTGVNTGANTAQFGMGETMRNAQMQNQMTPFQLWNQGLQGQLGFGNLSGQKTSGSTTGNQTTTSTPGLGQSLAGIAGMGMSMFGKGGMWPMFADGGAVKGYNDGGSVLPSFHGNSGESFADKVARAHETVSKLRASGGRTEKKEEPRTGQFSPRFDLLNRWAPTVTEERGQDPFMNPEQAQRMMAFQPMRPMQYELSELRGFDDGGSVLPEAFAPFQGFNASNTTPMGPAFGGNPFAQFMPSGETAPALGPETTGQILPSGGDPLTTSNVMEAYNPNGPPRTPPFNPSAPGPVTDPNATVSAGGSGRRQIEQMHPHQRLAAMLLSASGPGVLGPGGRALIDMHQQRIAEHGAELQADQLAQQLAHQNATLGLQRDQLRETTAHRTTQSDHQRRELDERARHNQATEELGHWQLRPDGSMINRKTGEVRASGMPTDVERRRTEAIAMGLDPGEPGFQQYVLTGKLGNTELNATQTNILHHAREGIISGQSTLRDITRALEINDNAYSGWGAEGRADIVQNLGGTQNAQNTRELARLMTGQMLGNLRATFGGNPTEGERAVLAQVEGSVNATPDERRTILTRAKAALEARMRLQQENIAAIEGRRFTQARTPPPAGEVTMDDPTAQLPAAGANPNAIPPKPNTVPNGSLYNPARKQWKAPDGKIYDAEGRPV